MDKFKIKKLQQSDLELAKELITLWQEDGFALKTKIPKDDYLLGLITSDIFHVYVALVNGKVVGGISAYELPMFNKEEHEMFLYDISVKAEFRQLGIAKALVEELKCLCVSVGINIMFVGTTIDNQAANQLYTATNGKLETISWFTYNL